MSGKKVSLNNISINGDILKAKPADFETAVSATGFGVFNILLFLSGLPSVFTTLFETSSLSYVFPAAKCDLDLSLQNRGVVNAFIYAGMISSSFIWGSLVDVFGRRKILITSQFTICLCIIMATFAPNYTVLVTAKFLGGFIINGQSAAMPPYLAEFHATIYRSRVPLTLGLFFSVGCVTLPLLAWLILPLDIHYTLPWGLEFHAWNLFLFLTIIPALTGGFIFILLPETPKYLMAKGNNEKALKVFQKIYRVNMRQPKTIYPINKLIEEQSIKEDFNFKEAWKQISPLFSAKYAAKLVLVCFLVLFIMMSVNTLRLWLPEIFQLTNDYEYYNHATTSFCQMLTQSTTRIVLENVTETCTVNLNNSSVYINSAIVAATNAAGYIAASFIINKIGKKKLLSSLGLVSGVSVASVYFAPNTSVALILICVNLTCACVATDLIITAIIDLFPTHLRASALSLALMCGRIGAAVGNVVFPFLLEAGCAPTFFTLGAIYIACTTLSLFLPNTDLKALE